MTAQLQAGKPKSTQECLMFQRGTDQWSHSRYLTLGVLDLSNDIRTPIPPLPDHTTTPTLRPRRVPECRGKRNKKGALLTSFVLDIMPTRSSQDKIGSDAPAYRVLASHVMHPAPRDLVFGEAGKHFPLCAPAQGFGVVYRAQALRLTPAKDTGHHRSRATRTTEGREPSQRAVSLGVTCLHSLAISLDL